MFIQEKRFQNISLLKISEAFPDAINSGLELGGITFSVQSTSLIVLYNRYWYAPSLQLNALHIYLLFTQLAIFK